MIAPPVITQRLDTVNRIRDGDEQKHLPLVLVLDWLFYMTVSDVAHSKAVI